MFGGAGTDYLVGGTGNDEIHGGDHNDRVYGGSDDDLLFGDAGNDYLSAGYGDDRLEGGSGNDKLVGGAGSDTFVFDGVDGIGSDRVYDFSYEDSILLSGWVQEDYEAVLASVEQVEDDMMLVLTADDVIKFYDFDVSELSSDMVMFA